jgi:SAM-dependent MidA family methyltransferase
MKNLNAQLKNIIQHKGPITFEKYMDLCLYWPNGGFYTNENKIIKNDYYTSPMAHPTFGALIALYLQSLWATIKNQKTFMVLEIGAGNFQLAKDITSYSKNLLPQFNDSLEYITLDIRKPQQDFNNKFSTILSNEIPFNKFEGVIILNEVFDAFPFHRITKSNQELKEIYVDMIDGQFVEIHGPISTENITTFINQQDITLEENQTIEISLKSNAYLKSLATILNSGIILNIDYGDTSRNLLSKFKNGSLSCYYQHTMSKNPYINPGYQDITSHVNFTGLINTAKENNLESSDMITQREFLYNLGFEKFISGLGNLPLTQSEIHSNRMGMLNLVDPNGLGNFKTLIHSKNIDISNINVLKTNTELNNIVEKYPIPLLKDYHIDLFQAKYPYQNQNWDDLFEIN